MKQLGDILIDNTIIGRRNFIGTTIFGFAGLIGLKTCHSKPREDKCVQEKLFRAAEQNILVYDANANVGILTPRLVSLMSVCFKRNKLGYFEHFDGSYSHSWRKREKKEEKINLHTLIIDKNTKIDSYSFDKSPIKIKLEYPDFDITRFSLQSKDRFVMLAIADVHNLKTGEIHEEYLVGSC